MLREVKTIYRRRWNGVECAPDEGTEKAEGRLDHTVKVNEKTFNAEHIQDPFKKRRRLLRF